MPMSAHQRLWYANMVVKVAIFLTGILIAYMLNPDFDNQVPYTLLQVILSVFLGIYMLLAWIEFRYSLREQTGLSYRASGHVIPFGGIVALVVLVGGAILLGNILVLNYQFVGGNMDRYYSYFFIVGTVILFAIGREEFMHPIKAHKAIKEKVSYIGL